MTRRRLGIVALIAAAAVAYAVRLGEPPWEDGSSPRYLFDETFTAVTAHRLLEGDRTEFEAAARRYEYLAVDRTDLTMESRAEWSHPPGAPLAIAPFIAAFGYSAVAVRLAALLAAIVTLVATVALTGEAAGWCACALLAFDGAFFVFARTAMPQMFLAAGLTAGSALLLRGMKEDGRRRLAWIGGAGAAFGYAASVRWTALPIILGIVVAVAASKGTVRRAFVSSCAVLGFAALATYLATFTPYLWRGHSLADLVRLHRSMLWFHSHLPENRGQSSPWYMWPWQMYAIEFTRRVTSTGETVVVWCAGGRLLWWALVPALLGGMWRARERAASNLVPVAAIAAVWLPWAFLSRYGYAYNLVPALPFAAALVARTLVNAQLRALAPVYVATAFALSAATYPVLAAVPLSGSFVAAYTNAFRAEARR